MQRITLPGPASRYRFDWKRLNDETTRDEERARRRAAVVAGIAELEADDVEIFWDLAKLGKKLGKRNGHPGRAGGWIYRSADPDARPIVQGWASYAALTMHARVAAKVVDSAGDHVGAWILRPVPATPIGAVR